MPVLLFSNIINKKKTLSIKQEVDSVQEIKTPIPRNQPAASSVSRSKKNIDSVKFKARLKPAQLSAFEVKWLFKNNSFNFYQKVHLFYSILAVLDSDGYCNRAGFWFSLLTGSIHYRVRSLALVCVCITNCYSKKKNIVHYCNLIFRFFYFPGV